MVTTNTKSTVTTPTVTEKKVDGLLQNKYVTLIIGAVLGALATYALTTPGEGDDKAVAYVTKQWTDYQAAQNTAGPVAVSTTAITTPVTQEQVDDAQESQEDAVK